MRQRYVSWAHSHTHTFLIGFSACLGTRRRQFYFFLVELVSPAVIYFALMRWCFGPRRTVEVRRGEEGMLCLSPIPPLSFYHFLSFPLYVSDEAPPVLGHSPRHSPHSLQRLGVNPPSAALNTKQASILPSSRVCSGGGGFYMKSRCQTAL